MASYSDRCISDKGVLAQLPARRVIYTALA